VNRVGWGKVLRDTLYGMRFRYLDNFYLSEILLLVTVSSDK